MYKDLNFRFFESFNRLDKLCREMYNTESKSGVTQYISDMEFNRCNNFILNEYDFNKTLKNLKRLRCIRNRLAHDPGAFQQQVCTEEDLIYIEKFYDNIMNQKDPLCKIYQSQKVCFANNDSTTYISSSPYSPKNKSYNMSCLFKVVCLWFVCGLFVVCFFIYLKATSF